MTVASSTTVAAHFDRVSAAKQDPMPGVVVGRARHRRLALIALLLFASACGVQRIRAYSDVAPPPGGVAIVRGQWDVWGDGVVEIERIDGVPVGETDDVFKKQQVIEILPGLHAFEVSHRGGGMSISNASVALDAQAGREYEIQATSIREGFWTELGRAYVGGTGSWMAWIVDASTGQVVSGVKPNQGIFTTDVAGGTRAPDSPAVVPVQR